MTAPNVRSLQAVRSYAITYYRGRRHRRYTIGVAGKVTLAQARAKAKKLLARATLGEDPQAEIV